MQVPLPPVDPVEFLCRFRIVLSVLSSNRETHGMSPPDVASNHPLVSNVLSNLLPQLRLDPQVPQRVIPSLYIRRPSCIRLEGRS